TVQPGMVYISNPTENGTLYTKKELTELSEVCHSLGLPLFLDGARMGYGLMAEGNDLTLQDIARLCDVFYIGGTKVGALFGEAVVITNQHLHKDFRYMIKQHGGMLAKGRLLGIQFIALFEEGLYFEISEHADRLAMKIKAAFEKKGYPFLYESATNQQFPIIPDEKLEVLKKKYAYSFWNKVDEKRSAVRFCTSWATREEDVALLVEDIRTL
ncbi:MAG TPA: beta-eliminating lyase-related protein, partial [Clostridiaceae bacterium]